MEGFEQERRGLFDGLQVPHSLGAILIAAIGLLVYWLGIVGIEEAHSGIEGDSFCRLLAGMFGNATARMGLPGDLLASWGGWENKTTQYDLLVWILFIGWTSAVWAFFAGAINRIAAMKLAREEDMEIRDAFKFAASKFVPNLLSIVFVIGIVGFFYLICNATIAGWIGRIPYVGEVLLGVFYFLVMLSSFFVVFASALGIIGFNLAASAIATESSDTFDGVSRAWNYVLARPWSVLLAYTATFLYIGVFLFFAGWFTKVSVKSLTVGGWGLGANERLVEPDADMRTRLGISKTMDVRTIALPGAGDFLYKRIVYGEYKPLDSGHVFYRQGLEYTLELYRDSKKSYPPTLDALAPYLDGTSFPPGIVYTVTDDPAGYQLASPGPDKLPGTADDRPFSQADINALGRGRGAKLDIAPLLGGTTAFLTYALFFWIKLVAKLLIYGYVVAYFLSSQTMLYFLLRRDVEGDDYTEIVLDEGEEPFFQPPKADDGGKRLPTAGSA
jgi:hypothetical protein